MMFNGVTYRLVFIKNCGVHNIWYIYQRWSKELQNILFTAASEHEEQTCFLFFRKRSNVGFPLKLHSAAAPFVSAQRAARTIPLANRNPALLFSIINDAFLQTSETEEREVSSAQTRGASLDKWCGQTGMKGWEGRFSGGASSVVCSIPHRGEKCRSGMFVTVKCLKMRVSSIKKMTFRPF